MKEIKAHGNRTLLLKGKEVGDLLGHVDVIPSVNLSDMSTSGEEHHAYAVSRRKGKHGISHHVTRRLGSFGSHEAAVAAVKKFHKLNEGTVGKKTETQTLSEDALKHQLKIASSTLKMSDAGASIMGGMSKRDAAKLIAKHKGPEHAKKILSQAGHTEEEIKKLLEGKKTDTDIISEAIESYLLEAPELRLVHGGKKTDPVMFRKSKEDGEVTAVFPAKGYEATRDGHATAYAHVGQHGAAHPDWIEQDTVPLDHTSPEAQSLHKELTGKGYKLEPISPEHHGAHIKNMKKRMAVVESVDSFLAETDSPHEPFPSKDFKKVKLGTTGKHTLTHVTRLKDKRSFYHLTDDWRADYPLHHPHNDSVAFDNPEYFPKKVVSWAADLVKRHAKGTLSESTESLIEENYKARLQKL